MVSVYLRVVFTRETGDVLFNLIELEVIGSVVDSGTGEIIVGFHRIGVEIAEEECSDQSHIFVVSGSASVVDL